MSRRWFGIMKARFWLGLHIFIIVNFVVEICYSGYMVFVIFSPESGGPLMGSALSFPAELMQTLCSGMLGRDIRTVYLSRHH